MWLDQEPLLKRLHNKEELTHQVTEKIKRSYKKNINLRYLELFCVILEININISLHFVVSTRLYMQVESLLGWNRFQKNRRFFVFFSHMYTLSHAPCNVLCFSNSTISTSALLLVSLDITTWDLFPPICRTGHARLYRLAKNDSWTPQTVTNSGSDVLYISKTS